MQNRAEVSAADVSRFGSTYKSTSRTSRRSDAEIPRKRQKIRQVDRQHSPRSFLKQIRDNH